LEKIKHKSRPSNENGWQVSTKIFRDRKKYAADWTLRAAAVMAQPEPDRQQQRGLALPRFGPNYSHIAAPDLNQ